MSILVNISSDLGRQRVISSKEAATFIGLSVPTLRRMMDRKALPSPIRLSDRRIGFRIGDLIDFLDCRESGKAWKDCRGETAPSAPARTV